MLQDVIDALRRNAPEAIALARAEVATAPDSADANHLLGMAQRNAGDRDGARASFDRAIELAPDESLYHFSRAMLAHSENDFATASRASAHAIALDPNQFGAYLLRVQLALASGELVEAERQLQLAERVDPDHPQLLFAAGTVALAKGDGEHAIELLSKAAAERPQDAQIAATLAAAYQHLGHDAFAEQAVRKAMALDPTATQLRRLLIESLIGQDRIDDVEAELATYRRERPHDPAGPVMDAELRLRARDPVAALAGFRAALAQAPRYVRALAGAQHALAALGDRVLARSVWEDVLLSDPGFDSAWTSRLLASIDQEDYSDVLRRWREALPESATALLHQARQDEADGRDVEAEAGYDAVLTHAPTQPDALFGKAMFELHSDPAAAMDRLDLLIAHASLPHIKSALATRGQAHDSLDHAHAAVADWQQAHAGLGSLPAAQPLPTEALAALALLPMPAATGDNRLVMLWGPPGSGAERLAAALRFSPSRPVLQDAPEPRPRMLQFPDELIARALSNDELPALAHDVADEYAQTIEPYLRQGNQGVFDWLAQWDARVVPLLRHAMPGTRLIAVLRDPRDLLLNWLAFGAPAGPVFADPLASATWLANQLDHLLCSRDALHLPVLIVDMDGFDADPMAAMQSIATFADLPSIPDPQIALQQRTGQGRLPTLLPVGRWHAYREQLADAFAVLAPRAVRLGYPSE